MLTVAIVASLVRLIYGAPTRAAAEAAIDVFAGKYDPKYDPKYEKAVACLTNVLQPGFETSGWAYSGSQL